MMEIPVAKSRLRTKIACEECRKNKRKCDGEKPSCTLCENSGRVCIYVSETSRKRKFYNESLVRDLENQIKALESVIKSHSRSNGGNDVGSGASAVPAASPHFLPRHASRPYDYSKCQSLVSEISPNGHGVTSETDARSLVAMEEIASLMLTMDIEDRGEPSFIITPGKSRFEIDSHIHLHDLPTLKQVDSNVIFPQQFSRPELRHIMVEMFMLHFNSFHQVIDAEEARTIISNVSDALEIDLQFRNNALLSVGAHLCLDPDAAVLGAQYAAAAESLALTCTRQKPSDLVVQGLSLLSWRELQLGNDSMSYNYIAMATGQILHLGLHVTALNAVSAASNINLVIFRRRIRSFWAYFSIDRIVTSSLGMNCTMHWQRVRPPPYLSIAVNNTTVDDVAHDRFCQLWHLWDSCMDQVHAFDWIELASETRKELLTRSDEALREFYTQTDSQLVIAIGKAETPQSVVWFQLSYHAAVLLIHRPCLNEPVGSSTLEIALRSATSAAASISRIIRCQRRHAGFVAVLPQVIEYILSASVIHLLNATSGRTKLGRQSANGLRSCIGALHEIHPRWKIRVQRSLMRIRELAHRWRVVWALPMSLSQPISPIYDNTTQQVTAQSGVQAPETVHTSGIDVSCWEPSSDSIDSMGIVDPWDHNRYQGALNQLNFAPELTEFWDLTWPFDDNSMGLDVNVEL